MPPLYYTVGEVRLKLGDRRFVGLANRSGATDLEGKPIVEGDDLAAVEEAIADACSEMDSYVGTRYQIPLEPQHRTRGFLTHVFAVIVYRMSPGGAKVSDDVNRRYDQARAFGLDVKHNRAILGTSATPAPTRAATPTSTPDSGRKPREYPTRRFSRANMRGL